MKVSQCTRTRNIEMQHCLFSDVVTQLILTPSTNEIQASWKLENRSEELRGYEIKWRRNGKNVGWCWIISNETTASTESCWSIPQLSPNTRYEIVVQPMNKDKEYTGERAVGYTMTLPEGKPKPREKILLGNRVCLGNF
jgi:hypothetical protein